MYFAPTSPGFPLPLSFFPQGLGTEEKRICDREREEEKKSVFLSLSYSNCGVFDRTQIIVSSLDRWDRRHSLQSMFVSGNM